VQSSGGFSETGNCSGVTLTPGQSCTITASFAPVVTGALTGTITINDTTTGAPHLVNMSGTGQTAVTLSSNITFPGTNVGSSSIPENMSLTNNGSQTLNFTYSTSGDFSAVGSNTSPCTGTLAAKAKCNFSVTFTPTFNGQVKGALTISFNGTVAAGGFTGTGQNGPTVPLTFTPTSLSFGNVILNSSSAKTVTIKNVSTSTVTLSSVTGSGYFTAAPSGTTPCGGALLAGKSCTVTVTYKPVVVGGNIGGITVIDDAAVSTQVQNAAGTGILAVTVSPTTINFGSVTVGTTSSVQVVTVTNFVKTAVPINSIVASGDFIYTTGGGIPCGATIPANSICTLGVEFSPTVTGAISGDLTLSDAAVSSPEVVSLKGTGQ